MLPPSLKTKKMREIPDVLSPWSISLLKNVAHQPSVLKSGKKVIVVLSLNAAKVVDDVLEMGQSCVGPSVRHRFCA